MTALLIIVVVITWWTIGATGFAYWWTTEFDLTSTDIPAMLFIGLFCGPLTWLMGRSVHGDPVTSKTLINRRSK